MTIQTLEATTKDHCEPGVFLSPCLSIILVMVSTMKTPCVPVTIVPSHRGRTSMLQGAVGFVSSLLTLGWSLELWLLVMTPLPTYTFVPGPDVLLGTSTAVLEGSGWFSSSQEAQRFLWALKATLVFQCHPTSWSSPQGI